MAEPRRRPQHPGGYIRLVVMLLKPFLTLFTKRTWRGRENIPASGGVIIAANHISHADPLTMAHFVYDSGRVPRFLAKASLFKVFFVGWLLSGCKQIPVYRESGQAKQALSAAVDAINAGEAVIFYVEGSTTKQPELWPVRGKTGAARVALETGAPVIPVASWGPQNFYHPLTHKIGLRPRTPVTIAAGEPIDIVSARELGATAEELTEEILVRIRALLSETRGEEPPPLQDDLAPPSAGEGA